MVISLESDHADQRVFEQTAAQELAHALEKLPEETPFAEIQQLVRDHSFDIAIEQDNEGAWHLVFRYPYDEEMQRFPVSVSISGGSKEDLESLARSRILWYL